MKKLTLFLFLVSVFLLAFLPVKDTDFGWHYRCGNQFLTTGRLCLKNEFSYFLSDYQAYNPSFIYDIILAFVYNHFGFVGISLLGSMILTFSAFFFFQLLNGPFWFRIISFYLMFFLSYSVFGLGTRSQIVSFLFFLITLYLLKKRKNKILNHKQILNPNNENNIKSHPEIVSGSLNIIKKEISQSYSSRDKQVRDDKKNLGNLNLLRNSNFEFRIYFLLSILLLIWVNTHIGFFLGSIILGIFAILQIVFKFNLKLIIFNFSLLTFNFLITFLNPFGPKVYLEIFRHAQAPLNTMIAEWVAPPWWERLLIIGTTIFAFIFLLLKTRGAPGRDPGNAKLDDKDDKLNQTRSFQAAENKTTNSEGLKTNIDGKERRGRTNFYHLFLLFLFAFFALTARRNLPYFYTIFFYIFSQFFKIKKVERGLIKSLHHLILPILISFIFFLTVTRIPQTLAFDQSWQNYCQNGLLPLPCQAVEKNGLKNLSGNLYTAYEWGGFLIWQAPKLKVFVDGRMSAWKEEKEPYPGSGHYPYQIYLYIIQAREGWEKILKKYHTDYLLIGNGTFLDLELQKNGEKYGFKEKYRDQTAVFYTL